MDVLPAIHTLAVCTSRRVKKPSGPMPVPSVVVMPVWHGLIGVQEKHQQNGLWSVTMGPHETSYDGACRAIRTLVQEEEVTPSMTCVAHTNGVSLWRADFSGTHQPISLNNPCQWMLPANFPPRKRWYQPLFEVLTHFGVWCTSTHSTVFNVDKSPSVGSQSLCVMKTTPLVADLPVIPTLLHDIRANTSDDVFLGDVLQAILDLDDNFYPDFFG